MLIPVWFLALAVVAVGRFLRVEAREHATPAQQEKVS
jgi:hypothetical protein